jgi:hypothetical protein
MAFPVGLPLRVAAEWVQVLTPAERLLALDALIACDPVGVAVVPDRIATVVATLGWFYQEGVLQVPAWPVRPPNPNVRRAWRLELGRRLGGHPSGEQIIRQLVVAWGEGGDRAMAVLAEHDMVVAAAEPGPPAMVAALTTIEPSSFELVPLDVSPSRVATPLRNIPLPAGARLVHGVKGDYYVWTGRVVYHPSFETFWGVYPKAVEKAEAYGIYLVIDPDPHEQEEINEGATRFARNPYTLADGKRFVVHPSRWLRRRRWQDQDVPVPSRSHEEISEHLERRGADGPTFTPDDFKQ